MKGWRGLADGLIEIFQIFQEFNDCDTKRGHNRLKFCQNPIPIQNPILDSDLG